MASNESSHSSVSPGSVSGTWWLIPSNSISPRYREAGDHHDHRSRCDTLWAMSPENGPIVVYTDGACRGNPGRGGWAWAVPDGAYASGFETHTTNQRMEITAALEALHSLTPDAPSGV